MEEKIENKIENSTDCLPCSKNTGVIHDIEFTKENFDSIIERMQFLKAEVIKYKYDVLTGLKQMKDFQDKLDDYFERYEFEKIPFCLVLTDADGLHNTNKQFGRKAGDELLIGITAQLNVLFGGFKHSNLYRISGDEFCVLISNCCKEEIEKNLGEIANATSVIVSVSDDQDIRFPTPRSVLKYADKYLTSIKMSEERL